MNSKPCKSGRPLRSVSGTSSVVMAVMLLACGATAARAQFLCPTATPGAGAAAGLDIPATTVTIAVTGESGPPGGLADVTVNMTGGDGNVASVFFDLCFDALSLDIAEMTMSTGAPCEEQADCPGDQECGNDGTCQANVVTACRLLGDLATAHTLVASSPVIPENPGEPEFIRRLRLAVVDGTRDTDLQPCTTAEDCTNEGEICPFGRCLPTCTSNEDCESGNRCKDLNDGSGDMVCSPLNIIPEGDLVECTFDIIRDECSGTAALDFTELLEAADDSIPTAMSLPAVGVPGSINVVPCEGNDDCPTPRVCVDDCRCEDPTPTATITETEPIVTPTPTPTGPTATPTGPTTTPTGPTATPTGQVTVTRTRTSETPTTPPITVTRTPTGDGFTRTPTPGVGVRDPDDDSCAIVPAGQGSSHGGFLLLVPALVLWARRRWR